MTALKAIQDGLGQAAEELGWVFGKSGQVAVPKNQTVFRDGRLIGFELTGSVQGNWLWSKDLFNVMAKADLEFTLRSSASARPSDADNEFDEPDGKGNYVVRDPDEVASLKAIYEKINPAARRDKKIVFTAKGTARAFMNVVQTRAGRVAWLRLYGAGLSDVSPLAGLSALTELNLYANKIRDLNPLAGLSTLTELDLTGNQISDLSPLAGLNALTRLNLRGNQISDVSPLAGLAALSDLDLGHNQISDLSPLAGLRALQDLYFTLALDCGLDLGPLLEMNSFDRMYLEPEDDGLSVHLYSNTE